MPLSAPRPQFPPRKLIGPLWFYKLISHSLLIQPQQDLKEVEKLPEREEAPKELQPCLLGSTMSGTTNRSPTFFRP